MSTKSFKRKTYGQVKPVKTKKVKPVRPNVRELKNYYSAVAKYGVWQQLDNVCYAMAWWDSFLNYYDGTVAKDLRSAAMSRKVSQALAYRKEGYKAVTDKNKIIAFCNSIRVLEELAKIVGFRVPAMKEYIEAGEKAAKKHKVVLESYDVRFERITKLITDMFPSSTLLVVVVPRIVDGLTGKDIGRKLDHTKNTIYYSRDQIKKLKWIIRNEGLLSFAISEAWWFARGMALTQTGIKDERRLKYYYQLMWDFEKWARRVDTPARLAKKPKKAKTVEEHLATDEIVSIEPMTDTEYQVERDTKLITEMGR
jgi:hypothetical protein